MSLKEAQLPTCILFVKQGPLTFLAYCTIELTFMKLAELFQAQAITHNIARYSSGLLILLIAGVPPFLALVCAEGGQTMVSLMLPLAWLILARLAVLKMRNHAS